MKDWNEIANMRTTLLHLQFICASLEERIEEQNNQLDLAHKDRLIQINEIAGQCRQLRQANFNLILIVKLEEMLAVYSDIDEKIWEKLDNFLKYVKYIEEQMMQDVGKMYLGNKVLLDIAKCQVELEGVAKKIQRFMVENGQDIKKWNQRYEEILQLKEIWCQYLNEVSLFLEETKEKYPNYLKKKLQREEQSMEKRISSLMGQIIQ